VTLYIADHVTSQHRQLNLARHLFRMKRLSEKVAQLNLSSLLIIDGECDIDITAAVSEPVWPSVASIAACRRRIH
jgi:hypothetical protein